MEPTRIPASLNEEDIFTLHMSIRQLVTVIVGFFVWFVVSTFTSSLLGINSLLTMLFFSWIFMAGIALAMVKIDGRKLDEYLGEKLKFELSPKTYILQGEEKGDEVVIEDVGSRIGSSLYDFTGEPTTIKIMEEE